MSTWFDIDTDNIVVDDKEKEVNMFVFKDDCGSVYGTLTFHQIEELCKEIKMEGQI